LCTVAVVLSGVSAGLGIYLANRGSSAPTAMAPTDPRIYAGDPVAPPAQSGGKAAVQQALRDVLAQQQKSDERNTRILIDWLRQQQAETDATVQMFFGQGGYFGQGSFYGYGGFLPY
jgi:hypothetical protein